MSPAKKQTDVSGKLGAHSVLALLLAVVLLPGCTTASLRSYEDPQTGISLVMPKTWKIERFDRYLSYVLEPKRRLFSQDSVCIHVNPLAVSNTPVSRTLEEGLGVEIDRLSTHIFKLDEVNYIQPIRVMQNERHKFATATISVPTISIPEGSLINQMGQRAPDTSQTIDIYIISNGPDFYASVQVYRGKNSQLNAQADAIVDTIRFSEQTK